MSENMTDSYQGKPNEIDLNKKKEANKLFELINKLNDDDINGSNQNTISADPIAPIIESLIKPIEAISINNNNNNSNNEIESKMPMSSKKQSRIPHIPALHKKKENNFNSPLLDTITPVPVGQKQQELQLHIQKQETSSFTSSSSSSASSSSSTSATPSPTQLLSIKLTHELKKLQQDKARNPRSVSKSANITTKTSRSMSTNTFDSREDLCDAAKLNSNIGNVKYVVNYKPKESQVKIFSKKVEIKNVSSKIGSLEKANYVPSGGNVVIESKPVNWSAKAKIGSLEYASKYTPQGGNVKIESRKLNWLGQSKIGSLKSANYQPGGGNVKIESHKLNFKEKARPKTNTGLVIIECNHQNSYLSSNKSSQSSSSGNISQQISPQSAN
jgi:hypothetical protein